MEHVAAAQQVVEGDADQAGRLADAAAREQQPEVSLAEAAVEPLLEQPERAPRVQELAVHARAQSSSLSLVLYFSISVSVNSAGAGLYLANSIVNSALPWVAERRSVE